MNFVAAAVNFALVRTAAAAPHLRVPPAIVEEKASFGFVGDGTMSDDADAGAAQAINATYAAIHCRRCAVMPSWLPSLWMM